MTDEVILGVIGTAVSLAQIVPLLSNETPRRGRIVAVLTVALVFMGGALWYREQWQYARLVEHTKDQVTEALNAPKTFDQLLADLYYPAYGALEDAIDQMIEEKRLEQRRILATSRTGDTIEVRVYAVSTDAKVRQAGVESH